MENRSYSDIIGSASAPYIYSLARSSASFTKSHAITHPSQPNYLALFSGSTQGVIDDALPANVFSSMNIGVEMLHAKKSFIGYSEDLPAAGYTGESSANYDRKHNPWVNFSNIPSADNQPFSDFPSDYSKLPTLSFVIPNEVHNMHSATIAAGDHWLKKNLSGYITWAKHHNSLLVVTWDEDDNSGTNRIPTLFVGPMVKPGRYSESITHYSVLRTLEDLYSLPHAGNAATATAITDVWR